MAAGSAWRCHLSTRPLAAHALDCARSQSRRSAVGPSGLPLWGRWSPAPGCCWRVLALHLSRNRWRDRTRRIRPASQRSAGQPDEDWRAYGRTQFGQRHSPLAQITPANVTKLKVAWTFRTGDLPGKNDPVETTFEVTPIKVRDTLYLCSQHQRLFAVDARTGKLRWSFDPVVQNNPTFQHLTCRGVSYHETAPGAVDTAGAAVPTDCLHMIFLPVNDGRMVALDADSGKACDSFADHGTLNLEDGMDEKTPGFYEPTSPPIVSDKILVVSGAVIDNYSAREPSGVIRGFDIHTGKLVWAWDAGNINENEFLRNPYIQTIRPIPGSRRPLIPSLAWSTCRWGETRTSGAVINPVEERYAARWLRSTSTPQAGLVLPDRAPRSLGHGPAVAADPG